MEEFNTHLWKCRTEKLHFYPHSLKLKRCSYNMRHFLPEEELQFHEIFCKRQSADLRRQLSLEPLELNVAEHLAAQKLRKEYEKDEESLDGSDDSDEDEEEKNLSVTSEIEKSDVEEVEMMLETINRLAYLEMKNDNLIL
ncbi:CHHC U11-48K-type domain-containing protein [Caenorhabditis elegans]|nr:CHHC U11-48K-type domain-containing protein [Caenorhabditis elegans]CTQ86661.1 CHHC U11-48K-type domain-containing protein [Caenorhabditis elegans]|eukprot:NP_001299960.1 GameTocyte Specific Factor 1 related [Caenorhabditis elegans]